MKFEDLKEYISNERNLAEEFVNEVSVEDTLILYGGGIAAYWYNKYFQKLHVHPDYILDRNPELQGKERYGIPVVSADFILENQELNQCKFIVTAPKFREEIIHEIHSFFGDVKTYSFEGEIYYSFISDLPVYRNYLLNHFDILTELYKDLSDQKSKETLEAFIKGRVSGNQEFFINVMVPDQYFPKDIIDLGENEVIIEAGSNDGKTLKEMIAITGGKFKRIYCFEPDRICLDMLDKIITEEKKPITLIRKGVGKEVKAVRFRTDSLMGGSRVVTEGPYDYEIEITTIDREIKDEVTMIKMDIEGLEQAALKGAERIIREQKPKLAICVYHEKEDIIEIWKWIKEIQPEYKFYLRHHNWGATETVLYAV